MDFTWVAELFKNSNFTIPAFVIIMMFLTFRTSYSRDTKRADAAVKEVRKAYEGSSEQLRHHNNDLHAQNNLLHDKVINLEKKLNKQPN